MVVLLSVHRAHLQRIRVGSGPLLGVVWRNTGRQLMLELPINSVGTRNTMNKVTEIRLPTSSSPEGCNTLCELEMHDAVETR